MNPKTADRVIRLLTIPVGLMGGYMIAGFVQSIYGLIFVPTFEGWDTVFTLLFIGVFMGSVLLGIGGLALHTAIVTWKQVTASRVRRLAAICAIGLWGLLMNVLSYIHIGAEGSAPSMTYDSIGMGMIFVCALVYLIASRWLIARSSLGPEPPRPAARHWIGLFCFLFWGQLSMVIDQWTRALSHTGSGPIFWVEAIAVFAPVLTAWLLYKTIVYVVDYRYKRYEQNTQFEPVSV